MADTIVGVDLLTTVVTSPNGGGWRLRLADVVTA